MRIDAPYISNRNPFWVKATCRHRDIFAVAAWASKSGRSTGSISPAPRTASLLSKKAAVTIIGGEKISSILSVALAIGIREKTKAAIPLEGGLP